MEKKINCLEDLRKEVENWKRITQKRLDEVIPIIREIEKIMEDVFFAYPEETFDYPLPNSNRKLKLGLRFLKTCSGGNALFLCYIYQENPNSYYEDVYIPPEKVENLGQRDYCISATNSNQLIRMIKYLPDYISFLRTKIQELKDKIENAENLQERLNEIRIETEN